MEGGKPCFWDPSRISVITPNVEALWRGGIEGGGPLEGVAFFLVLSHCSTCNFKVNSVQEACAKCFAVHILKFEIFQNHIKKQNKKHQNTRFIDEKLKTKSLMFFVSCDLQDFKF